MPAPTTRAELDTVETTTTLTLRDAPMLTADAGGPDPQGMPYQPAVLEVYVCDDRDEDEPPYVEVTARGSGWADPPQTAWTNDRDHDHGTDLTELPAWLRVLVADRIPEGARPW